MDPAHAVPEGRPTNTLSNLPLTSGMWRCAHRREVGAQRQLTCYVSL